MTGDLYINGLDAYVNWGVGLEMGALEALMSFKPNKEPVTNKNVTAEGSYYVCGAGLTDERTVSIPIHIVSQDRADFLIKLSGFYETIKSGLITIDIRKPVVKTYKMYYVNCTNYGHNLAGLAKFMLTMLETNGGHDGDDGGAVPSPTEDDLERYLIYLLEHFGRLATEQEVRDIVRNYPRTT